MWYVLGAVALVAVVVAAASVLRRPSHEDMSSVRHYHSALGTLEHLSERLPPSPGDGPPEQPAEPAGSRVSDGAADMARPSGAVKPSDGGEGPRPRFYRRPDTVVSPTPASPATPAPEASRAVPRSSRQAAPERGRPDPVPLVFDDVPAHESARATGPSPSSVRPLMDRGERHALDSMNHRPRRGLTAAVVIGVAVALFGVLAIVGSGRHHRTSSSSSTAAVATSPSKPAQHKRAPTTTAPAQLVAESSTAATALYSVGSQSYAVKITASGPCWVDATTLSTGTTLWTGTMQAGAVQEIQASGGTKVELGTLAVAIDVDGVPVVVPSTIHSPFVLTFEPSSPTSTSTTSATAAPFG